MLETTYGDAKRLAFLRRIIEARTPAQILDIGCGTGTRVTRPLADAFPSVRFLGVDADETSIAWARGNNRDRDNLSFAPLGSLAAGQRFDLVIASEVIEHVADPFGFLLDLRGRLTAEGAIAVTLPNGFGPFEAMALTECLLHLSRLQSVLRWLKYKMLGRSVPPGAGDVDTLAVSPHVNFFGIGEITGLFTAAGLRVLQSENRTALCGYILDDLIRGRRLIEWNARIADRLPAWSVSDWMFELEPVGAPGAAGWRRGRWARFRKRLNEQRWGIA
jgi:SAM-dependent methyltransferase